MEAIGRISSNPESSLFIIINGLNRQGAEAAGREPPFKRLSLWHCAHEDEESNVILNVSLFPLLKSHEALV